MHYRSLGSTGLKVSELGLGCSNLGNAVFNYGSDNEFTQVLNYAFENGINFFDTADTYSYGNSETLIGKAFKNKRDSIIISTKVGFLPSSLSSPAKMFVPFLGKTRKLIYPFKKYLKKASKKRQNFSEGHIRESIEKSLTRLNTDYIDIYLLHNPSAEIIKKGNIFKVLDDLKNEGKIRYYGVSANSIDDAVLCLNFPDVTVIQIGFNLLNRKAESQLFPFLKNNPKGIIARIPLARGLLTGNGKVMTGAYTDSTKFPRELKAKINRFNDVVRKKILPEAAFRFILGYQEVSTLIAGTRSVKHLEENIKSVNEPALSQDVLNEIVAI